MLRSVIALLILTIAVVLVPAIQHLREGPAPLPPAVRLSLNAPPGTELGSGGETLDAAISPDQRVMVFVATQRARTGARDAAAGATQLWRRRLAAEEAEPIAGTEGAQLPAWKQTGNILSFFADGRLKLLNLRTGTVTAVADAPAAAGAAWLRDGSLLFVPAAGPVRRLSGTRVSDATRLAAGDTAHGFPVAAGGEDFVYVAERSDGQKVIRLHAGGQDADLGTTTGHAALPRSDWLLFVKNDTLLADSRAEDGTMARRELSLAADIGTTRQGRGLFAASADVLLYARAVERPVRLTWLDQKGSPSGSIADVGDYWQVRVSPDGRNLAVTSRDRLLRSLDVLMIPIDEALPSLRLTTSISADTDPVWAPEGRRLAFRTMQRGRPEVRVTPAALTGSEDASSPALPAQENVEAATDWRHGEMLVQTRGAAGFDLVRVDEQTGMRTPVAVSTFNDTDGRWSPDGRWIAYVSDEPGRPEIYVVGRVPPSTGAPDRGPGNGRQRVSFGGGTQPRWTRDSRALLFLRGSTIMRAEVAGATRLGSPRPLADLPGIRDFDISRQTDRIIALLPILTDPAITVPVMLNWRSLAEQQRQLLRPKTPPKF